jgi:hypothetical protein
MHWSNLTSSVRLRPELNTAVPHLGEFMKKSFALSLLVAMAAHSAFASGSPVLYCNVPGTDKTIYLGLDDNSDDSSGNTYNSTISGPVSVQDQKGNEVVSLNPATKDTFGKYESKQDKQGATVSESVSVRFKGIEGSVINLDASDKDGKGMHGRVTFVLRGKDAQAQISDLRSVPVTCTEDYE